jgi:hypothetical protein
MPDNENILSLGPSSKSKLIKKGESKKVQHISKRKSVVVIEDAQPGTPNEDSCCLACHWSQRENILFVWLPIGHRENILVVGGDPARVHGVFGDVK